MNSPRYENGFKLTIHEDLFEQPLSWKKPQTIFVNSMSDLFHGDIPVEKIQLLFNVMNRAHWHRFQILTKRAGNLARIAKLLEWGPNIWMGVTVESAKYKNRIDALREVPAAVRFLSLEPLIAPLGSLNLTGIHWVIVGGESGPRSRPIEESWVDDIYRQCVEQQVPFFFKQWGGVNKKASGRLLHGRTYDEMPV